MNFANNKTLEEGDFGSYVQITEKLDNTEMDVEIMYVVATSDHEVKVLSNCSWEQPPVMNVLSNQKVYVKSTNRKGIEAIGFTRSRRAGMKCYARFSESFPGFSSTSFPTDLSSTGWVEGSLEYMDTEYDKAF